MTDGQTVEYQPWVPPDRGFYVYRMWASDGHSVYVGMVGQKGPAILGDRLRYHEMAADWWPEVAHIDWAEFGSTRGALDEETRQIAQHVPVHNKLRPKVRGPGVAVPAPRPPAAEPAPSPARKLPRVVRPPRDKVSDSEFAEWPYWVETDRGWKRLCTSATGPGPGDRWYPSQRRIQ